MNDDKLEPEQLPEGFEEGDAKDPLDAAKKHKSLYNEQVLRQLYRGTETEPPMTIIDLADFFGMNTKTISKALEIWGIEKREHTGKLLNAECEFYTDQFNRVFGADHDPDYAFYRRLDFHINRNNLPDGLDEWLDIIESSLDSPPPY